MMIHLHRYRFLRLVSRILISVSIYRGFSWADYVKATFDILL